MSDESKSTDSPLKNHYQVLDLPQDCSFKDIRESYFKLSKQYHPDHNPEVPESHKSFLKIHEAYTVLSKPQSRQLYDVGLMQRNYTSLETSSGNVDWSNGAVNKLRGDTVRNPEFVYEPWYGIKGIKRVSNSTLAIGCILYMFAGICFHYAFLKKSTTAATEGLDKKDHESIEWYNETRKRALANTKEANLEMLRQRFEKDKKQ